MAIGNKLFEKDTTGQTRKFFLAVFRESRVQKARSRMIQREGEVAAKDVRREGAALDRRTSKSNGKSPGGQGELRR